MFDVHLRKYQDSNPTDDWILSPGSFAPVRTNWRLWTTRVPPDMQNRPDQDDNLLAEFLARIEVGGNVRVYCSFRPYRSRKVQYRCCLYAARSQNRLEPSWHLMRSSELLMCSGAICQWLSFASDGHNKALRCEGSLFTPRLPPRRLRHQTRTTGLPSLRCIPRQSRACC